MCPIDLLALAATAAQPRAARVARNATRTPRAPSVAARCLQWIEAQAIDQGALDAALPLNDLVSAWCAEHYPSQAGRLTPEATVESQIRTLAKAGALPAHFSVVSAKVNLAEGRSGRATIVVTDER